MRLDDNIKDLKEALKSFEGLKKSQEETFNEAMEQAKSMPESEERDWAINSLLAAKAGTLSEGDFINQMKSRGYGG